MSNPNQLFVYRHIPSGMLASAESPSGWCWNEPGGYTPFVNNDARSELSVNAAMYYLQYKGPLSAIEKIPAPENLVEFYDKMFREASDEHK